MTVICNVVVSKMCHYWEDIVRGINNCVCLSTMVDEIIYSKKKRKKRNSTGVIGYSQVLVHTMNKSFSKSDHIQITSCVLHLSFFLLSQQVQGSSHLRMSPSMLLNRPLFRIRIKVFLDTIRQKRLIYPSCFGGSIWRHIVWITWPESAGWPSREA